MIRYDKNIKWADGKVKALGAWFCIDCEESKKKNYEEKVHTVEDSLNNNWRNKRLTLIHLVKSHLLRI